MSTFTVSVEIPDELRRLGISDEQVRKQVPILLVLKRFREGAMSSGKAAEILGMTRRDFLDLLDREGIPIYAPTESEVADEVAVTDQIRPADA